MSTRPVPVSIAIALGFITVLGPASVDMYLPFIPVMAEDLNTQYATMQLTLTVFFFAMGAGQLLSGPVIDAYGRRKPLLAVLLVFVAASIWATTSQSVESLIVARLIQGLAVSLALVTAMSTVRDVAEGVRAVQLFAVLMTIQGLSSVLAPAVGGVIGASFGWRSVFGALAAMGFVVLINSAITLRETLPAEKRSSFNLFSVAKTYLEIVSDRRSLVPGLALAFVFFFLFAYVGGAAYMYQAQYGVSARSFGTRMGTPRSVQVWPFSAAFPTCSARSPRRLRLRLLKPVPRNGFCSSSLQA